MKVFHEPLKINEKYNTQNKGKETATHANGLLDHRPIRTYLNLLGF